MSSQLRLVLIIGALLTAAIAGAAVFSGGAGSRSQPGPAATPSPTPSPSPIALRATTGLAAGTYVASMQAGRLVLTLPSGWSAPQVTSQDFRLHLDAGATDDVVPVFFDMRRAAKDAACTEAPEPGVGATAQAIAANLVADRNLRVATPTPIVVNGLSGSVLDVTLAASTTRTCPFSGGKPSIPLVVDTLAGAGAYWGIGPGERIRLVLLDAPANHNVVIAIDSLAGTSYDALVGAAMPIVQSLAFTPG